MRLAGGLVLLLLGLAGAAPAAAPPARVVSMNLCTDQLALLLARPGQLAGVSRVATDPVASALWREAAAVPAVPADAEAIHRLAPDLVLAGAWDPPATLAMLRRLGLRVETFRIEESFADIRANVGRMGALLGNPEGAAALLAAMEAELAEPPSAPPRSVPPPRAALYYANGYTSGAGTLADEILTAAGLANVAAEHDLAGLAPLPLERLVMAAPDLLVTGQAYASPALAQGILEHPALRALGAGRAVVADNLWDCGTPLAARAVTALRAARPE
jgi:iron complex transport system substrate-binding protein